MMIISLLKNLRMVSFTHFVMNKNCTIEADDNSHFSEEHLNLYFTSLSHGPSRFEFPWHLLVDSLFMIIATG